MSDETDVSITPNTDDPRSVRLREDGVDISAPDFDAEADEKARKEREEAVQKAIDENSAEPTASEKAAADAKVDGEPADTSAKPKTGSIPKQAPASETPAK